MNITIADLIAKHGPDDRAVLYAQIDALRAEVAKAEEAALEEARDIVAHLWDLEVKNRPTINVHWKDLNHAYTRAQDAIQERIDALAAIQEEKP